MAKDVDPATNTAGRIRGSGSLGYGKGAVLTGGVLAVGLITALAVGGFSAVSVISERSAAAAERRPLQESPNSEAPPTPSPGNDVPGSVDPITLPDRDSDQPEEPGQGDEIYFIQDGDTLTALSAQFGMSIDYIADYNAVRDVNVLSEGAVLRVPYIYLPPADAG